MFIRVLSHNATTIDSNKKQIAIKKKANSNLFGFSVIGSKIIKIYFKTSEVRRIPAEESEKLKSQTVIVNTSNGNSIIFQPLSDVHLLRMNDDGEIEKVPAIELQIGDTICCFSDEDDEFFYLDDVQDFYVSESIDHVDEDDILEDEEKEPKILSNYIINTEKSGLIINDIFLC